MSTTSLCCLIHCEKKTKNQFVVSLLLMLCKLKGGSDAAQEEIEAFRSSHTVVYSIERYEQKNNHFCDANLPGFFNGL